MINKRGKALEQLWLAGDPEHSPEDPSGASLYAPAAGMENCGPFDRGHQPLPSEISCPVI